MDIVFTCQDYLGVDECVSNNNNHHHHHNDCDVEDDVDGDDNDDDNDGNSDGTEDADDVYIDDKNTFWL